MRAELDRVLEQLIAECSCDSCERYRKWFFAQAASYAKRIEEALTPEVDHE